jgi:hypothetical protein
MTNPLLFVLLFVSSPSAFASAFDTCRGKNPSWYVCTKNEDCEVIVNPCGHPTEAAHRAHAAQARRCNINAGAALDCATWSDLGGEKTTAKCQTGSCIAEKIPAPPK